MYYDGGQSEEKKIDKWEKENLSFMWSTHKEAKKNFFNLIRDFFEWILFGKTVYIYKNRK